MLLAVPCVYADLTADKLIWAGKSPDEALAAVLFEGYSLYMIRDGLILNIVNLLHPFPSISEWQSRQ